MHTCMLASLIHKTHTHKKNSKTHIGHMCTTQPESYMKKNGVWKDEASGQKSDVATGQ